MLAAAGGRQLSRSCCSALLRSSGLVRMEVARVAPLLLPSCPPPCTSWRLLGSEAPAGGWEEGEKVQEEQEARLEDVQVLVQRLLDTHGRPVPSMTSERLAAQLVEQYCLLAGGDRHRLLLHLASHHCVSPSLAQKAAASLASSPPDGPGVARLQESMRNCLVPPHNMVFTKVGQLEGGVKFLVNLRADLLAYMRQVKEEKDLAALRLMNSSLQALLGHWFSVGFLRLQRVDWNSPCSLLQRVSDLEAVHPVRDWTDLRARVGPYRRCYVYSHPSMPGEPVVILHVALTEAVATSISGLVKGHRRVRGAQGEVWGGQEGEEREGRVAAAIFYSVTSTQAGLAGIELGTHLIKGAVASLAREFPALATFSTLSPIPGFRAWLLLLLTKAARGEAPCPLAPELVERAGAALGVQGEGEVCSALAALLRSSAWVGSSTSPLLEELLPRLAARYLYREKRRRAALCPVANFHIRNGACLWRVNWMADPSPRGMEASCGLMVNYRYYLERLESNSTQYLTDQTVDVDRQVTELLE